MEVFAVEVIVTLNNKEHCDHLVVLVEIPTKLAR